MPDTFTFEQATQPEEKFTFDQGRESDTIEGMSMADQRQLESDWDKTFPKEKAPGFIGAAVRSFDETLKATGGGIQIPMATDQELADHLNHEYQSALREEPMSFSGKAGSIAGNLAGTLIPAAILSRTGKIGPMAQFASMGAYDSFMHAGFQALKEGRPIEEAVSIGRKQAGVGATLGAGMSLLFKGGTPDWRAAAREGLKMGAAGAAARTLENLAEQKIGGLKTPLGQGVLEQGAVMGALAPTLHGIRAVPEAVRSARDWYEGNVNAVRPVPMPPEAGPEVPIDAEVVPPETPQKLLTFPEPEPAAPTRKRTIADVEEELRNLRAAEAKQPTPEVSPKPVEAPAEAPVAEPTTLPRSEYYHGTREILEGALRPGLGKDKQRFLHEEGIWFAPNAGKDFETSSVSDATRYSGDSGTIVKAKLSMKNPYYGDVDEIVSSKINTQWLRDHGYDGFVDNTSGSGLVAVLEPSQIKEVSRSKSVAEPAPAHPVAPPEVKTTEPARKPATTWSVVLPVDEGSGRIMTDDWRKSFDQSKDIERKIDWLRAVANKPSTPADLTDVLNRTERLISQQKHSRLANTLWDVAQNPATSPETKTKALTLYEDFWKPESTVPAPTEPVAPAQAPSEVRAKEPWEMSGQELKDLADKLVKERIAGGSVAAPFQAWQVTKKAYVDYAKIEDRGPIKAARAHEATIKRAVERGDPVPATVLADYPELVKKGEAARPAPPAPPAPTTLEPPLKASDKSVRDLPVSGKRDGNKITIQTKVGRSVSGKFEFKADELAGMTKFERHEMLNKRFSNWDEEPGGAGQAQRLRDSVRNVLDKLVPPKQSFQERIEQNQRARLQAPEPPAPAQTLGEGAKGIAASAREKLAEGGGGEVGAINIGAIAQTVERNTKALVSLGRSVPNRHVMDQTFDAADTLAAVTAQQARTHISIGTNPLQRDAAMAVVEAKGDRARLTHFLAQSITGGNKRAERAVRYAINNWGALQALAGRVKSKLDEQIAAEQHAGINTEYREGYVPHLYDTDLWMGQGRPYVIGKGGGGIASGFKKGRTFETIFDAIEQGYVPKSMDVGELVEHRVKVGQRMINRRLWGEALRSFDDPSDNKPIVTSLVSRPRGPNRPPDLVPPTGYETREILPGVRIAVHEGYTSLFDALTGTSRVSANAAGYALLKTAGGIKHGLLLFDTFHMGRILMRQLFLTGKPEWTKGVSLLEYNDADLNRAIQQNLITPEIANWVRTNRPNAQLLLRSGLNVGRIQEALYTSFVRDTIILKQTVGKVNKWIFEKLTRGAMMESALIEFERQKAALPNMSDEEVARKVARELNVYFGNIGSQGILKSKTYQDLSRLIGLAPQWVESMANLELKGAAQAVKGVTYDPAVHRRILIGSLGKGLAQGILAMFVAAQIINLIFRKKPTWENEEKGHKLDAWIPDVTGKTPGFFLSPLSVQAELTHDFIRYNDVEPSGSKLAVAARIAANKASPYVRALKVLGTGKDWDNRQLISDWEKVKAAAWALAPTPIPLSSLGRQNAPPGSLQRQLTASAGLKTEPAARPSQQMFQMVNDWMKDNKDPKIRHEWERRQSENFAASDYKELEKALRGDDPRKAQEEYDKLLAIKKTREQILKHFQWFTANGPKRLTGSTIEVENRFRKTLTPEELRTYNAAITEKKQLWEKFRQFNQSRKQ